MRARRAATNGCEGDAGGDCGSGGSHAAAATMNLALTCIVVVAFAERFALAGRLSDC
jgi:hypothetical protein